MDDTEARALVALSERDSWTLDQLPPDLDVAMLRCLDAAGLIEVRFWCWENQQRYPGDPTPLKRTPYGGWFSPLKRPTMSGSWDAVLTYHKQRDDHLPHELRVSEHGKVELARLTRAGLQAAVEQSRSGLAVARSIVDGDRHLATLTRPLLNKAGTLTPQVAELINYLRRQSEFMIALADLPEKLRDADVLAVADADGLIEFGHRAHCWAGQELRVEQRWEFCQMFGPNTKSMARSLRMPSGTNAILAFVNTSD